MTKCNSQHYQDLTRTFPAKQNRHKHNSSYKPTLGFQTNRNLPSPKSENIAAVLQISSLAYSHNHFHGFTTISCIDGDPQFLLMHLSSFLPSEAFHKLQHHHFQASIAQSNGRVKLQDQQSVLYPLFLLFWCNGNKYCILTIPCQNSNFRAG